MNSILHRRRDLLIATGLCILGPARMAQSAVPRRLKLKNVHTGETFEGPYRDDTGPIPDAIADLVHFLRDFHVNRVGPIDVGTLDFLADVMDAVGESTASVLSAYRTPETNAKLRATMFGVAEKSQHMYGRAIDVSFDRRLVDAETAARRMARGASAGIPARTSSISTPARRGAGKWMAPASTACSRVADASLTQSIPSAWPTAWRGTAPSRTASSSIGSDRPAQRGSAEPRSPSAGQSDCETDRQRTVNALLSKSQR
jgi:uncharacterized protein YcbK (DUF882 family)